MSHFNLTFKTEITKPDTDIKITVLIYRQEPNEYMVPIGPPVIGQTGIGEDFKIQIEDIETAEYTVKLIMEGKTDADTEIVNDEIISSAELCLSEFKFDDFDLTEVIERIGTYNHNFNGNGDEVTESFSSTMGCNGEQEFKFSTPLYLWLLKNIG